jgi:hypothetical protein
MERGMREKTKEYLVDSVARANQIIFAVLIVGPFVSGFNLWLFVIGVAFYLLLLGFGMRLTRIMRGE